MVFLVKNFPIFRALKRFYSCKFKKPEHWENLYQLNIILYFFLLNERTFFCPPSVVKTLFQRNHKNFFGRKFFNFQAWNRYFLFFQKNQKTRELRINFSHERQVSQVSAKQRNFDGPKFSDFRSRKRFFWICFQ